MCLAVPMRLRERAIASGIAVRADGGEERIDLSLVPEAAPGQWLLVFLGAAREVVTAERAAQVERALGALGAALVGDVAGIEAAFADLIERTPQLPAHLRPAVRG